MTEHEETHTMWVSSCFVPYHPLHGLRQQQQPPHLPYPTLTPTQQRLFNRQQRDVETRADVQGRTRYAHTIIIINPLILITIFTGIEHAETPIVSLHAQCLSTFFDLSHTLRAQKESPRGVFACLKGGMTSGMQRLPSWESFVLEAIPRTL